MPQARRRPILSPARYRQYYRRCPRAVRLLHLHGVDALGGELRVRGVCPSCTARRMADTAVRLVARASTGGALPAYPKIAPASVARGAASYRCSCPCPKLPARACFAPAPVAVLPQGKRLHGPSKPYEGLLRGLRREHRGGRPLATVCPEIRRRDHRASRECVARQYQDAASMSGCLPPTPIQRAPSPSVRPSRGPAC